MLTVEQDTLSVCGAQRDQITDTLAMQYTKSFLLKADVHMILSATNNLGTGLLRAIFLFELNIV